MDFLTIPHKPGLCLRNVLVLYDTSIGRTGDSLCQGCYKLTSFLVLPVWSIVDMMILGFDGATITVGSCHGWLG